MRQAGHPRRYAHAAPAAAYLLFSFVYLALFMTGPIGLYDEGVILTGARRVMDGDLIHRDFYANYGPGQFYALAALFEVFSPSILVERLWHNAVLSLTVAAIFLIVARTTRSTPAAVGTAAIAMIWLGSFGFYGYPVFPALAAALTALLCLLPVFEGRRSPSHPLAAGLCAGVAFVFRYDIGLSTAAALAAVLGLHAAAQPTPTGRRLRDMTRCVGLFMAGFAVVAAPLLTTFAVYGALGDLVFDVVTYPAKYYNSTRSLPFPGLRQLAETPAAAMLYLPLLLAAAAIPAICRTGVGSTVVWAQRALIALTLVFFAKGFVRVSPIHMAMAIIAALVLTGIATAKLASQRGIQRTLSIAMLFLVAAFTSVMFALAAPQAAGTLRTVLATAMAITAASTIGRPAAPPLDQDHLGVITFLKAHSWPRELIYVGVGRHDKIFANDVALYFLADQRPATKWQQFDPGLQTSAPIQQEMIGELTRNRPHYVVLERQWDAVQEPNASAHSSGVTMLDGYIRQHFHTVATFGAIQVLEQDTEALGLPP